MFIEQEFIAFWSYFMTKDPVARLMHAHDNR